MVTITDVIKYQVAMQSQEIYRLKATALETQPIEKYQYISSDGKTKLDKRPEPTLAAEGWKMEKIIVERVVQHISPKHPSWQRYLAAKHRASLLLTARLLLKLGSGEVPDLPSIRQMLLNPHLCSHAHRGQARSLCFSAYRYLRKMNNRLNRAPEKFNAVREGIQSQASDVEILMKGNE
jgi:hypothetical protein